ncbi:MAG: type III-A CRISPR-associated RAMP protein Csm3 [Saprospiraceae bacterium]|nr:MAG: type III-A CRISPR-associated RAMP protein Csm3 [Saprospiraceae bacterium]
MAKLLYKLHITGDLVLESGLHIGGSEADLDIGGIDKEVIKVKQGTQKVPYIPGSSLKGKLRSLLARHFGYSELKDDRGAVLDLFGTGNSGKKNSAKVPSRLIVRDTYLKDTAIFELEDKAENTIDRLTGSANPRHLERVVKGAIFGVDLILDIYAANGQNDSQNELLQTIDLGFQLLKKDYLGGGGTRGSGSVDIQNLEVKKIKFNDNGSLDLSETVSYQFKSNTTN